MYGPLGASPKYIASLCSFTRWPWAFAVGGFEHMAISLWWSFFQLRGVPHVPRVHVAQQPDSCMWFAVSTVADNVAMLPRNVMRGRESWKTNLFNVPSVLVPSLQICRWNLFSFSRAGAPCLGRVLRYLEWPGTCNVVCTICTSLIWGLFGWLQWTESRSNSILSKVKSQCGVRRDGSDQRA